MFGNLTNRKKTTRGDLVQVKQRLWRVWGKVRNFKLRKLA